MITSLLLALVPLFQASPAPPIQAGSTLGPVRHETVLPDPVLHVYKEDVPGHIKSVSLRGEVIPNIHMVWTNPSNFNRTVRLVVDYDVWHDRQPSIPSSHKLASVIPDVNPPPPLFRLGNLVYLEGPWITVPPGQQIYLFITTPVLVSKTFTIPYLADNASLGVGNPQGIPAFVEEDNVGPISDGFFNWVFTDLVVGQAPVPGGGTPIGTPMYAPYTWTPVPIQNTILCSKGPALVGGKTGFVWGQAWDLPIVGQTTSMWVESYSYMQSPITPQAILCNIGPWRRCLETLYTGDALQESAENILTNAMPGETRVFQFWYSNSIVGSGTSDSVRVTFN